jgi:hypothetical protein
MVLQCRPLGVFYMRNESFQSGHRRSLELVTVLGLVVICALTVVAQSGRRAPKSAPIPAPTPESSPTPTAKKSPEKPALPLIVGIGSYDSLANIPLYFNDSVLQSCVERLRDEPAVSVDVSSRDVSRGDAVKRAKAEKEGYVVLLQLRLDSISASSTNANLSDVYIEYFVFAPTTAKQVVSGRTYQQAYRSRGVVLGPGTSGNVYAEYRLKQAAREAAERILHGVHLSPPPGVTLPQP